MTFDKAFIMFSPAGEREIYCSDRLITDKDGRLVFEGGITVRPWLDEVYEEMPVACCDTSRDVYCHAVDTVARDFCDIHGKAVICRKITGQFRNFDFEDIVKRYFSAFENMFCFVFYHPRYNFWMGATPELLVELKGSRQANTRALAGTRNGSETGDWDSKNLAEHAIVVDDICRRIKSMGNRLNVIAGVTGELSYGAISHLCTPISIEYGGEGAFPLQAVADAIHPTPAVGGFPREKALFAISGLEDSRRFYYGGLLMIPGCVYVVLRCVHFDTSRWCVYSGSGVTGDSNSVDEWNETAAKARPLVDLLNSY